MVCLLQLFLFFQQYKGLSFPCLRSNTNVRCSSLSRYRSSSCLHCTDSPVCASTLWHTQSWILVCTCGFNLASMHQCYWIMRLSLESSCISSTFSILHV